MNAYQIVPWDHLDNSVSPNVVLEQYVPPEVEAIAEKVLKFYNLRASRMQLITSKPDKGGAIWKLETDKGPRSLKVLHRLPQRSLFSIGAQKYLVRQGARVPALVRTTDNRDYVEAGGKLWIVTDWIEPLQQTSKVTLKGAMDICYGLGEFHRHSKGYVPPFGSLISSRTGGWFKYYEKLITKIDWFDHIASVYPETSSSKQLLSVNSEFKKQARHSMEPLRQSQYSGMVAMGDPHWGLAHQDYGWSNGQMGPGGIWVIDLDGVSYDLPIRDLRKLITSTMDDKGNWDLNWIRGMIDAYNKANPLDRQTYELLLIDMAFPSEFYKHVKEIVYDPVTFMNTELQPILQRLVATEATKWTVLKVLAKDSVRYPKGDYSALPAASPVVVDQREALSGTKTDSAASKRSPTKLQPLPDRSNVIPLAEHSASRSEADKKRKKIRESNKKADKKSADYLRKKSSDYLRKKSSLEIVSKKTAVRPASKKTEARPASKKTEARSAARKTAARAAARKPTTRPAARKTAVRPARKPSNRLSAKIAVVRNKKPQTIVAAPRRAANTQKNDVSRIMRVKRDNVAWITYKGMNR